MRIVWIDLEQRGEICNNFNAAIRNNTLPTKASPTQL